MPIVNYKPDIKGSMDGYLKRDLDTFRDVVYKDKSTAVILIDGKSNSGKTTISFQCASYCDPNFSLDNVHFDPESFLEGLRTAKPFSAHILDEAMQLNSRGWASKMNRMVIVAMSVIRSKQLFIFFNINSIFDIDRQLILHRADMLLHTFGDGLRDKGKFAAFYKAKGDKIDRLKSLYINGKKYYSYNKPRANFYSTFTKQFVLDEKEYEAKKQIVINKILNNPNSPSKKIERNILIMKMLSTGLKQVQVAEVFDLNPGTIKTIKKKFQEEDIKT